jgi:hypothetical protein
MAFTQNNAATYARQPRAYQCAIGNSEASSWLQLAAGGANGSKINALMASSSDTSARVVQLAHARSATVTVTIASPGVFTWSGHNLINGDQVILSTTGSLPTGLTAGTTYYVVSASRSAGTFQLASSVGGAAINTSGSQSGTHTAYGLRIVGSLNVATPAGTDGNISSANLLSPIMNPGLPVDNDQQPYLILESGDYLLVSTTTTVTANKVVNVVGTGADF